MIEPIYSGIEEFERSVWILPAQRYTHTHTHTDFHEDYCNLRRLGLIKLIVTIVVVTRNGRCLVCYAENFAPKEALIVKEWNVTGKN